MDTQSSADASTFLELTARIVASYVSNNSIAAGDLSSLIDNVHAALHGQIKSEAPPAPEPQKPAVPIRKSITPDYIICLEDGLQFKSLKRHLRTAYSMTPAQYREKWNLPPDYPMVAPNYAAQRSNLAKTMGLGRKRDVHVRIPEPEVTVAPAKPTRGRRKAKAS